MNDVTAGRAHGDAIIRFIEANGQRMAVAEPRDRSIVAQALVVHGLTEHCGRPLALVRWLALRGIRALVPELLDHGAPAASAATTAWVYDAYGQHETARGVLEAIGKRGNALHDLEPVRREQYRKLRRADARLQAEQVATALAVAIDEDPELPTLAIGHSMGGLLTLEAAWRWSEMPRGNLRGIVLLSPALRPTPPSGKLFETVLFESIWRRRNRMSPARAALKGALGLNLPVDTTSGNRWLSDLPDEIRLYAQDPLIPDRLPSRYVSSIETQMARTDARGPRLPVPTLVIVPEIDGITSADAGVELVRAARRAASPARVDLVQLDGLCAHDVVRSSGRARALDAIAEWIDRTALATQPIAAEEARSA